MTTEERFNKFHTENPKVYELLIHFSKVVKNSGQTYSGISMIWERMRWNVLFETTGDFYKLNNDYRSRYARLIMTQEPDLVDFFEIRKLRS